jgi:nitrate reductase NapAB chaperone NapD
MSVENTYTIEGLKVPHLEAKMDRLLAELSALRAVVVRLDDEVGGLIKILENAEVTAEPDAGGEV